MVAERLLAGEKNFSIVVATKKYGTKTINFEVGQATDSSLAKCIPREDSAKIIIFLDHPHFAKFKGEALREELQVTIAHELAHAFTPKLHSKKDKRLQRRIDDSVYRNTSSMAEVIAYSTEQIFKFKLLLDYTAKHLGRDAIPEMRQRILRTISTQEPSPQYAAHMWRKHLPADYRKHVRDLYKFVTTYDPLNPQQPHYPEFEPAPRKKKLPAKKTWRDTWQQGWSKFRNFLGWHR